MLLWIWVRLLNCKKIFMKHLRNVFFIFLRTAKKIRIIGRMQGVNIFALDNVLLVSCFLSIRDDYWCTLVHFSPDVADLLISVLSMWCTTGVQWSRCVLLEKASVEWWERSQEDETVPQVCTPVCHACLLPFSSFFSSLSPIIESEREKQRVGTLPSTNYALRFFHLKQTNRDKIVLIVCSDDVFRYVSNRMSLLDHSRMITYWMRIVVASTPWENTAKRNSIVL